MAIWSWIRNRALRQCLVAHDKSATPVAAQPPDRGCRACGWGDGRGRETPRPVEAGGLGLLAPRFFPLWDNPIARERRIRFVTGANNWPVYWQFTQSTQIECLAVGGEARHGRDLLKQLDEFYYCRAQGWM